MRDESLVPTWSTVVLWGDAQRPLELQPALRSLMNGTIQSQQSRSAQQNQTSLMRLIVKTST